MKNILLSLLLFFSACSSNRMDDLFKHPDNEIIAKVDPFSRLYVPVKRITAKPGYYWFAYYDKIQCDPANRYVLGMKTMFEHRSPTQDDVIEIGMIDLHDNCK